MVLQRNPYFCCIGCDIFMVQAAQNLQICLHVSSFPQMFAILQLCVESGFIFHPPVLNILTCVELCDLCFYPLIPLYIPLFCHKGYESVFWPFSLSLSLSLCAVSRRPEPAGQSEPASGPAAVREGRRVSGIHPGRTPHAGTVAPRNPGGQHRRAEWVRPQQKVTHSVKGSTTSTNSKAPIY